jgi:hypothetical protein
MVTITQDDWDQRSDRVNALIAPYQIIKEFTNLMHDLILECDSKKGQGMIFFAQSEAFNTIIFQVVTVVVNHQDSIFFTNTGFALFDRLMNQSKEKAFSAIGMIMTYH